MLKLMKLEWRKNNIGKYIRNAIILAAVLWGLSSFLCKFLKKYFGEGVLPDLILRYSFELIR